MASVQYVLIFMLLGYTCEDGVLAYIAPVGTPVDVTTLDLQSSGITDISVFEPDFVSLSKLQLTGNLLSQFPNLTPLSDSLTWLELDDNLISSVDAARLGVLVNLDRLYMKRNQIKTLPTIGTPSALTKIFLDGNPLSSLPALGEFGANVQWLEISETGLSTLDPVALAGYKSCILVNMRDNAFTRWPDFSPIAGSFVQTDIQNNPLSELHLWEILRTPKFRTVKWSGSPLSSLPNLCHTPITGSHWTGGWVLPLRCDCHLRWLKMALAAGKVKLWYGDPICASPGHLAGQQFTQVDIVDLSCDNETVRSFSVQKIVTPVESFSCVVPVVTQVIPGSSVISCSEACISTPGCSYFSIEGEECGVTDLFSLTSLDPADNADVITNSTASWYTVD